MKQPAALLVLDMQVTLFPPNAPFIVSVVAAIAHARAQGLPLLHVATGFRPGGPELHERNKTSARIRARYGDELAALQELLPAVAPLPGEVLIIKRRVSAFVGTDLELVLRSAGVHNLVLIGFATSGAVLSTVRDAADKDYGLTVLADCCADPDEEVHRVLTTKVFPRQAEVLSLAEWQRQ